MNIFRLQTRVTGKASPVQFLICLHRPPLAGSRRASAARGALRERGKAGLKIVYDLNFPPNLSDLAVLVEPLLIVRGAIREQLAQVHAEGCTEVQGYFFSALRPASEIPKLLSTLEKVKVAA